jgi:hypothetical protein
MHDFDLRLSLPRHPGQGFCFLPYARQRRQFIPQGAMSVAGITFAVVGFSEVMSHLWSTILLDHDSLFSIRHKISRKFPLLWRK